MYYENVFSISNPLFLLVITFVFNKKLTRANGQWANPRHDLSILLKEEGKTKEKMDG